MQLCWMVRINNFEAFIEYISEKYKISNNDLMHFKNYYDNKNYLYLLIDNNNLSDGYYQLTYADCDDNTKRWLSDINNWEYQGEFLGRKQKLDRLYNISKL